MKNIFLIIVLFSLSIFYAIGQVKIGGNTSTIDNRSILELEADNLGIMLTRLSTTQRDAVLTWEVGHVIFNSTDSCFQFFDGIRWECIVSTHNDNGSIRAPRRNATEIANLTNVVNGTIVYNTTEKCLQFFVDNNWLCIDDIALNQATGGGARSSLLGNCGCADTVGVVGGSSGTPFDLTNTMNNYCGILLKNGSSTSFAYYRLPNPANYAGQYFCIRTHMASNSSTTAFLRSHSGSVLVSLHWNSDIRGTSPLATVELNDPARSSMIVAKVFSNGTYWFVAAGY